MPVSRSNEDSLLLLVMTINQSIILLSVYAVSLHRSRRAHFISRFLETLVFPPVRRCNAAWCVDSAVRVGAVLRSSAPQFVMFKVNLVGSGQSA